MRCFASIRNSKGFSLIESMIAASMLAVIILFSISALVSFRKQAGQEMSTCRLHTQGVIERFRGIGLVSEIGNYSPVNANRSVPPSTPPFNLLSRNIPNSERWTGWANVLGTGAAPEIGNSVLINGSLNALLAIYNKGGYCASAAAYTGFTDPEPILDEAATTIRIQPYDLTTGLPVDCSTVIPPLYIFPQGSVWETDPASAFQSAYVSRAANYRSDLGLLLTVNTTFEDSDNNTMSCFTQQRFQYSADTGTPEEPNYATITMTAGNTIANPRPNCVIPTNTYTIEIGFDSAASETIEAGSVLVCRDRSERPSATDPSISGGQVLACYSGPGLTGPIDNPQVFDPSRQALGYFVDDNETGLHFTNPVPTTNWMPCDQVTACGKAPTSATLLTAEDSNKPIYQLQYDDLPTGCRVRIEATAIDTAANPSSVYLNPVSASTLSSIIIWDVPAPRCGSICYGGPGPAPGYYFSCGGC